MMKSKHYISYILILSILCLLLSSCHKKTDDATPKTETSVKQNHTADTQTNTTVVQPSPSTQQPNTSVPQPSTTASQQDTSKEQKNTSKGQPDTSTKQTSTPAKQESESNNQAGSRDNTPVVLLGQPDGTTTIGNDTVTIDLSHTDKGYLMIQYRGNSPKVKFQLTGPDSITYTYNLTAGNYDTFPLTASSGAYTIGIYENIKDTSYSTLFSDTINAQISDSFAPYLYANQYVNFNQNSHTVAKGSELAANANCDIDVIQAVYNNIISTFSYDDTKAENVQSGYLPNVDQILASKTGICFDYAAVMATMLRTQRIPTRLEVGYVNDVYHAWISTYVDQKGWVNGIIKFDGKNWSLMDPTFASTSSSPQKFLSKNDEYHTKYIY